MGKSLFRVVLGRVNNCLKLWVFPYTARVCGHESANIMKQFFKNNYALLMGIVLPLALIAVFFLAGKASVVAVPDPQYDAVFATNYSSRGSNNLYRIGTDDGKLYIRLRSLKKGTQPRYRREPVIYLFDHKTLFAREIDIDFDNVVDGKVKDPELDALNRKRINPNPLSPDGYTFERNSRSGSGLFAGLFGSRRNRSYHVLRKGVRTVPVVGGKSIYSAHFIGWVVK